MTGKYLQAKKVPIKLTVPTNNFRFYFRAIFVGNPGERIYQADKYLFQGVASVLGEMHSK